jgi:hypothetical protein
VKAALSELNPLGMGPIDQGIGVFLMFIIGKGKIFGFDLMILLSTMLFAILGLMAQTMEPYSMIVARYYYQFRE